MFLFLYSVECGNDVIFFFFFCIWAGTISYEFIGPLSRNHNDDKINLSGFPVGSVQNTRNPLNLFDLRPNDCGMF